MIEVKPEPPAEAGVTTMWLRPNRAMSERGMWLLGLILVAVAMITALLGAQQGNVFAPLFALVESVAVAGGLVVAWMAGNRCERIRLDADVLEVESRPGRHCTRFQSGWVRVCLMDSGSRQQLLLASHGRSLEIGAFLADEERETLRRKLNSALQQARAPQKSGTRDA